MMSIPLGTNPDYESVAGKISFKLAAVIPPEKKAMRVKLLKEALVR
jgi:hypothetical protein